MPTATLSQTYLTRALHRMNEPERVYRRSVMELAAAAATILSADYQHGPTKMVWRNGTRW